MLKYFWFGGETKTWAARGGQIGAVAGILIGGMLGLYLSISIFVGPSSKILLVLSPLLGLIFGFAAGLLVGIGTPRVKNSPHQGGWSTKRS